MPFTFPLYTRAREATRSSLPAEFLFSLFEGGGGAGSYGVVGGGRRQRRSRCLGSWCCSLRESTMPRSADVSATRSRGAAPVGGEGYWRGCDRARAIIERWRLTGVDGRTASSRLRKLAVVKLRCGRDTFSDLPGGAALDLFENIDAVHLPALHARARQRDRRCRPNFFLAYSKGEEERGATGSLAAAGGSDDRVA